MVVDNNALRTLRRTRHSVFAFHPDAYTPRCIYCTCLRALLHRTPCCAPLIAARAHRERDRRYAHTPRTHTHTGPHCNCYHTYTHIHSPHHTPHHIPHPHTTFHPHFTYTPPHTHPALPDTDCTPPPTAAHLSSARRQHGPVLHYHPAFLAAYATICPSRYSARTLPALPSRTTRTRHRTACRARWRSFTAHAPLPHRLACLHCMFTHALALRLPAAPAFAVIYHHRLPPLPAAACVWLRCLPDTLLLPCLLPAAARAGTNTRTCRDALSLPAMHSRCLPPHTHFLPAGFRCLLHTPATTAAAAHHHLPCHRTHHTFTWDSTGGSAAPCTRAAPLHIALHHTHYTHYTPPHPTPLPTPTPHLHTTHAHTHSPSDWANSGERTPDSIHQAQAGCWILFFVRAYSLALYSCLCLF